MKDYVRYWAIAAAIGFLLVLNHAVQGLLLPVYAFVAMVYFATPLVKFAKEYNIPALISYAMIMLSSIFIVSVVFAFVYSYTITDEKDVLMKLIAILTNWFQGFLTRMGDL